MLGQTLRQLRDRTGLLRRGLGDGQQVERQRHPIPGPHRRHLVTAVGIERDHSQLRLRRTIGPRLTRVLDNQLPTGMRRRQRHHQRAHHRVVLLRILMRQKELPLAIHQHRMRLRDQPHCPGKPQRVTKMLQRTLQQRRPPRPTQRHLIRRQLPGIPHPRVGQRLLTPPEHRRPRHRDQLPRRRRPDRQAYRPHTGHLKLEEMRRRDQLGAERPRRLRAPEQPSQPLPRRRRHKSPLDRHRPGPATLTAANDFVVSGLARPPVIAGFRQSPRPARPGLSKLAC